MNNSDSHPGKTLAGFAAGLTFDAIPDSVVRRAEDLCLDWVGSALAGKSARPVEAITNFAERMGPGSGTSEILVTRHMTSPLFAALVNAAASHVVEQDDLHNSSVLHPGSVVFPPALAIAQESGSSGREFLSAVVAGYEVGVRVGEYLGRSHYDNFHTTGTVGTLAAAAASGRLLGLDSERMLHAIGSAATQAAGLWAFLREAADSKQLHTAKAAANGVIAAYLSADGFTGAQRILDGEQGLGIAMSDNTHPEALTDRLGERWALAETSFKFHASCRHTHPAADALLAVLEEHNFGAGDIAKVTAHVHRAALDVLGAVGTPQTVHQAKFSMGTVLAVIALRRSASVNDFENCLNDPAVADFRDRVSMMIDAEVDAAYPARWLGRVTVTLNDGSELRGSIDEPRGDPGNSLNRNDLETKFRELAAFRNGAMDAEANRIIDWVWSLEGAENIGRLLQDREPARDT